MAALYFPAACCILGCMFGESKSDEVLTHSSQSGDAICQNACAYKLSAAHRKTLALTESADFQRKWALRFKPLRYKSRSVGHVEPTALCRRVESPALVAGLP